MAAGGRRSFGVNSHETGVTAATSAASSSLGAVEELPSRGAMADIPVIPRRLSSQSATNPVAKDLVPFLLAVTGLVWSAPVQLTRVFAALEQLMIGGPPVSWPFPLLDSNLQRDLVWMLGKPSVFPSHP